MNEQLGIENLKVALVAAISLGEKIEGKLDDGKLTGAEALSIAVGSFGSIVKVVKSAKQIKAEYLDLDEQETKELGQLIKDELELENENIEVAIEKAIDFLYALDEMIDAIKGVKG